MCLGNAKENFSLVRSCRFVTAVLHSLSLTNDRSSCLVEFTPRYLRLSPVFIYSRFGAFDTWEEYLHLHIQCEPITLSSAQVLNNSTALTELTQYRVPVLSWCVLVFRVPAHDRDHRRRLPARNDAGFTHLQGIQITNTDWYSKLSSFPPQRKNKPLYGTLIQLLEQMQSQQYFLLNVRGFFSWKVSAPLKAYFPGEF